MVAVTSVSILSGCKKGENAGEISGTIETTEKSGEQQVLEVALFEGGLGKQFWEEIISEFEETHPDIKVNATINPKVGEMIRPKIVAGNPPDFVDLSDTDPSGVLPSLIKDRQLVDITDVV
jgi:N-acetylglucosamine transport system substrate-binding protein